MNNIEKLAIMQALYSAVGEHVSTKTPGNLRAQVDEEIKAKYEQDGAKSFDMRLNGESVGTMSVVTSKAQPEKEEVTLHVKDPDALYAWCAQNGFLTVDMGAVEEHFRESGVVPDGTKPITVVTPAVPSYPKHTTIKVRGADVARVMGDALAGEVVKLLGDENV